MSRIETRLLDFSPIPTLNEREQFQVSFVLLKFDELQRPIEQWGTITSSAASRLYAEILCDGDSTPSIDKIKQKLLFQNGLMLRQAPPPMFSSADGIHFGVVIDDFSRHARWTEAVTNLYSCHFELLDNTSDPFTVCFFW